MIYSLVRIVLALAGAAVVFVMLTYSDEERRYMTHSIAGSRKAWIGAISTFTAAVVALHLIPVENLIIDFSKPEDAFYYNHTGEILEIDEYGNCALVINSTGDEKITIHVLPIDGNGKYHLETIDNRRRRVSTFNYCMIEQLYVPGTDDCFVIISHSTEGNISDIAGSVLDNRNTQFNIVDYPDHITFYYGFVEEMTDDYTLTIDGNIAIGA